MGAFDNDIEKGFARKMSLVYKLRKKRFYLMQTKPNLWIVGGSGKLGHAIVGVAQPFYNVVNVSRSKSELYGKNYEVDLADDSAVEILLPIIKEESFPKAIVFCQRYRAQGQFKAAEAMNVEIFSTQKIIEEIIHSSARPPLSIVIISSANGILTNPNLPFWYHLLKAGQIKLTKYYSVYNHSVPFNINCIAAGTFLKDDVDNYPNSHRAFIHTLQEANRNRKVCTVQDIAQIVEFLISDRSQCINGQIITPDGGFTNNFQEGLLVQTKT